MRFLLGFGNGDFGAAARFTPRGTNRRHLCAGILICAQFKFGGICGVEFHLNKVLV